MSVEPEEGYVTSGGFRLHYIMWNGDGPSIVLLHSFGMDAHSFDEFSQAASGGHRILALDLLDLGDSEKPGRSVGLEEHAKAIRGAYTDLGFTPNILVGHSIGGMIGTVIAAEYPKDLKGLVLVDIAPIDRTRLPMNRPKPPEEFDEEGLKAYLKERYPRSKPEFIENRMRHAFIKGEDGKFRFKYSGEAIRGHIDEDLWPYVERLVTPTLLLLAGENSLITPDTVDRMRTVVPLLDIVVVRGATHAIPQDRPDEFRQLVESFVARVK